MDAYKKTLRICSAIRILASMLESFDPMTRDLLEISQRLTKTSLMWCVAYSTNTRMSFEHELQLLSAYLEISESSGLVSPRTVSVLKSECSNVMDMVKERGESTDNNILPAEINFPKGMFDVASSDTNNFIDRSISLSSRSRTERKNINANVNALGENDFNKRHLGQHIGQGTSDNVHSTYVHKSDMQIRKNESVTDSELKDKQKRQKVVTDSSNNSDRRNIIVTAVRKMGSVTIKDLSPFVSGVSEKTIQRELVSLVSQGVLKKEGERRWSRYQVAEGAVS